MIVQVMPYPAGGGLAVQATTLEDGSNLAWYGNATYPAAFYDSVNDETWLAWEAWTGRNRAIKCAVFDHATSIWGDEFIVSHEGLADDNHGVPAICMDSAGHVHCFSGAHASALKHSVTLNPRDNSAWVQLDDIGTDLTYPHPVLVGSTLYLFARGNSRQSLYRYKGTGTGLSITWGAVKDVVAFTGGRFYMGTAEASGTNIHIIATYSDGTDTFRRDIYHFVYDTTDDSLDNSAGGTSTAVGSQPISKATADSSYLIYDQTTNNTSIPVFAITPDGKIHAAFIDGTSSPYDIRHMVFSGGSWSSSTVVATSTGANSFSSGGSAPPFIELVPNADNSLELWFPDDDGSAFTNGGDMKRIVRSSGGSWGSEVTIGDADVLGLCQPSHVRSHNGDIKVIFTEDGASESDSAAGGIQAFAYGDGGYVGRTISLGSAPSPETETVDPHWYNNALVVTFDGSNGSTSFTDDSRFANALTANGSAQIQSNKLELNGTTSYVTAASGMLWTPGSKISIELFDVEFDDDVAVQVLIGRYRGTGSVRSWELYYADGVLVLYGANGGSTNPRFLATAPFLPATDGTGYDIGVFWDGRSAAIAVDGVVLTRSAVEGSFGNAAQVLSIGCDFDSGGTARQFFNGRIAALRITRGVDRSAQANYERHALPLPTTAPSLTDSNWADVKMLIGYDSTMKAIRDFGPLDVPLTVVAGAAGDLSNTLADSTPSISFNGSTGYVWANDDPLLELGSSDFTIEAYARHASVTAHHQYVSKYTASGNTRSLWFAYRGDQTPDVLQTVTSTAGTSGSVAVFEGSHTPTANVFFHGAVCLSGNDLRQFAAGTQVGSTGSFSGTLFDQAIPWRIGVGDAGTAGFMSGNLAEVRVTKAARYTSGFTAPTGAFPRG